MRRCKTWNWTSKYKGNIGKKMMREYILSSCTDKKYHSNSRAVSEKIDAIFLLPLYFLYFPNFCRVNIFLHLFLSLSLSLWKSETKEGLIIVTFCSFVSPSSLFRGEGLKWLSCHFAWHTSTDFTFYPSLPSSSLVLALVLVLSPRNFLIWHVVCTLSWFLHILHVTAFLSILLTIQHQ